MTRFFTIAGFAIAALLAGSAGASEVTMGKPIFFDHVGMRFAVPAAWEVHFAPNGVAGVDPSGEMSVSFLESNDTDRAKAFALANTAMDDYMRGAKWDEPTDVKQNGLDAVVHIGHGTDVDGHPIVAGVELIHTQNQKWLVVFVMVRDGAFDKHKDQLDQIMSSVAAKS